MKIQIPQRMYLYFALLILGASGIVFPLVLPHPTGIYAFIIIAAVAGFGVAVSIFDTKRCGEHLVCPTGSNCDAVTSSKYSRFFGVSLEYWGMAYFGLIALAYTLLVTVPGLFSTMGATALMLLSMAAGLFSLYLLFVQAFLLRQWCIWCLLTAFLSLAICIASFVSADVAVLFLQNIEPFLDFLRSFGFALGVGGMSAVGFLFFHFLADGKIDEKEADAIKSVLDIVWVGFGLLLVSKFAMLIANPMLAHLSDPFMLQLILLVLTAVFGALLMLIYAPFLMYVPFEEETKKMTGSFSSARTGMVGSGVAALLSWYAAFILQFVSGTSIYVLLGVFCVVLLLGIGGVLWWDRRIASQPDDDSSHTEEMSTS